MASLDDLVPTDMDQILAKTLRVFENRAEYWPALLDERLHRTAERRDMLISGGEASCDRHGPVIAAAPRFDPATATLLATIAKLPQGALVLPGLDTEMDDATWK